MTDSLSMTDWTMRAPEAHLPQQMIIGGAEDGLDRAMTRPLILIPARFSASAAALRFEAEVTARKLAEAVFDGGAEPLTVHPFVPGKTVLDAERMESRFGFVDGVLLPGGGDIAHRFYDGEPHASLYDVDEEQDLFDFSVARWAHATSRPTLAICRGLQVVNVDRGGTLHQDMPTPHRHMISDLGLRPGTMLSDALGIPSIRVSCYHHQALDRLGRGMRVSASASDGTVEAVELATEGDPWWFLGVQWHPEDSAAADPAQHTIFAALTNAARGFASRRPVR
jgi:putative glutamine amidotransferase